LILCDARDDFPFHSCEKSWEKGHVFANFVSNENYSLINKYIKNILELFNKKWMQKEARPMTKELAVFSITGGELPSMRGKDQSRLGQEGRSEKPGILPAQESKIRGAGGP
jgi:hypothetical protein